MAKSVNSVQLLGNVGKDVEIKYSNGLCIVNLSLATNERRKVDDQWTDVPEWHHLVLYDRVAEIAKQYVEKGSKIHVQGRLRTRSWDATDGSGKRYRTEIVVHDIVLLSGRESRDAEAAEDDSITDDDIPF